MATTEKQGASSSKRPVATVETKPAATQTTDFETRDDGTLSIEKIDIGEIKAAGGYKKYWVGTRPDSLMQNIDVHGVGFPRFVGVCCFDDTGKPDRPVLNGQIVNLTDDDVARCLKAMRNQVLRRLGRNRGVILNMDDPSYRPNPQTDRPLGEVLYMVRTDQLGFEAGNRRTFPDPLIK